jgi:hypothetical protein
MEKRPENPYAGFKRWVNTIDELCIARIFGLGSRIFPQIPSLRLPNTLPRQSGLVYVFISYSCTKFVAVIS